MAKPKGPEALHLFEKWMGTTTHLFERTARFPKRLRHSLTNRMEQAALEVLEHLTGASWSSNPSRALSRASSSLDHLRVLTRLASELGVLTDGQYEQLVRRYSEAGSMLGAWINTASNRSGPSTRPRR